MSVPKQMTAPGGEDAVCGIDNVLQPTDIGKWVVASHDPSLVTGNNLREGMLELQSKNISCDVWVWVCQPKKNSGLKFLKNSIIIWKAWCDLLHACVREVSKIFKKKIITGIKTWNSHFWELCKSWINAAEAQGFSESIVCSRLELQPVQSCVIRLRNLIDLSELVQHCERRPPSGGSDAA